MQTNSKTSKIVLTAMMMCLVMVSILFLRIPIPFTQGYVHLGDAMIFISVLVLGWKYGTVAAAFGGMLGDVIGGFAAWAPWTFCIKGIMALVLGLIIHTVLKNDKATKKKLIVAEILGMIVAGVLMVIGYYVAEGLMYGSWTMAALGIPWNIGQFVVGMVIAVILVEALAKTPIKKYLPFQKF